MAVLMDVLLVLVVLAAVAVGYRQGLIKMLITFAVVAVAFTVRVKFRLFRCSTSSRLVTIVGGLLPTVGLSSSAICAT